MQVVLHVGLHWWERALCKIQAKDRYSARAWDSVQNHLIAAPSDELYVLCIIRLPKNLHRLHHWQDFDSTKPICVCTVDVLAYFGCKNCNHYLSKDQWNKNLVIWAVMMSALIAHTNQVHNQMCAVGGGEFVDAFEPTSLFRLSWTHLGSDVCAELVKQRALSYPFLARARPWVKLGCIIPALRLPRPSAESRGDILRILENHQRIS